MVQNPIIVGLVCLAFLVVGCATPSQPTGGPRDEEGPDIIKTEPQTGTTNFSKDRVVLYFSEFVERSSLIKALIVEPDIGIDYKLDWGRKSVKVKFDQAIPDSTTLIITVGTELSDVRNNEMGAPQKIAVSTGPEIDKGKLFGRIIGAQSGEGTEGRRVLLYREPIDLTGKADYIASTDTSGAFQFSYLSEGKYQALWVDDRNRNKIWEEQQERAQPFSQEYINLAKAEEDTLGALFIASEDTTRPVLQGVGLFSSQRLRMRFSKNIQQTDSTAISITDTLGQSAAPAYPLYVSPEEPFVLFVQSKSQLQEDQTYAIDIDGIVDEFGNKLKETNQQFTGSAQEDTTLQRIITRNNLNGYYPSDPVKVIYAKPIEESDIVDSLKIIEGTELIEDWPEVSVKRNVLQINPAPNWKEGVSYEFRIWDPIIEDYRKLNPTIWHQSEMGSLKVTTEDSTRQNIHLQIRNEESGIIRDTVFTGSVEVSSLPPLNYKVTAYQDLNENEQWDHGHLDPYEKPEPYFIQLDVPVKKGLTADLVIAFQN